MALNKKKTSRLSSEAIPTAVAEKVIHRIRQARVNLLLHQPFFGNLATSMILAPADAWLETMAVDGKYLYYNHKFVELLSMKELEFVVSHEVLHIAYDHLGRREYRNAKLYNVAADFVVNDELIVTGVGQFPQKEEVKGLHDVKYRGWSSEQVYDDLLKQQQNKTKGQAEQDLEDWLDQLLDDHLDATPKEGENQSQGNEKPGKTGPVKMSDAERQKLREELKNRVISAAKLAKAGTLPAGIERLVSDLTNPKMDWKQLLQANLTSLIPFDYSFQRPSRNGWHMEAILPGIINEEQISIAVAIDTSGSISDEDATAFLSEINGIMGQYTAYTIYVFCFDTEAYNARTFTSDDAEDITAYKIKGGGGTDGGVIFRHLKDADMVPEKLIVFTDGYVGDFGDPVYCDTIWVIKGSNVVPPFGQYAPYDGK